MPIKILRVILLLSSFTFTMAASAQANSGLPCSDSLYTALKKRPVDSLSAREYEMFRERDRACLQAAPSKMTGSDQPIVQPTPADASETAATAAAAGRELAESQSSAGWFVGGLASGVALGLIGTAIIYAAASNSGATMPSAQQSVLATKSPLYSESFTRSFREQMKSRHKSSAVGGGLLGTAAFVVIYLSAQGQ